MSDFHTQILNGYSFKGPTLTFGAALKDSVVSSDLPICAPLKMLNRHGLISGATGTGKTKTLQVIAEQLSENGVPVLLMDIKGDLSGIAQPSEGHPKINERHEKIGIPFSPSGFPVELLTISKEKGVRLRATVSEFGPILFSKILGLNDTQTSVMSMLFKFCDDQGLALLDLKDMKAVLKFAMEEGEDELKQEYGHIAPATLSTILRNIIELEQQGGELFFGEESFEVEDLCGETDDGKGTISILRVTDIQRNPKLFSTFMLCLLAEVYEKFEEQGDQEKPELVIFIDEAHLLFEEASEALLKQLEQVIKLIRSKGVGIFFCTQNPTDIPEAILSQLGLKVQHALRAFTAKDRKEIKEVAQNYPLTNFYDVEHELTSLGIGEALITVLGDKGAPTPLVATMLRAPQSRMGVLSDLEIDGLVARSELVEKYNKEIDRESAYEKLSQKIKSADDDDNKTSTSKSATKKAPKEQDSLVEKMSKNTMVRQIGRTIVREIMRGLMGVLGIKQPRRRRRRRYYY